MTSLFRRKSLSYERSPSPSTYSNGSARSMHSNCEHRLHLLDYDLCLSCLTNRQRSKSSSGGLMSKIARRLGRISTTTTTKPDAHNSSDDLPTSGEGEGGGREELVQSASRSLKVPTPRMHQKKLKSMSTSHLETSYDGYKYNSKVLDCIKLLIIYLRKMT